MSYVTLSPRDPVVARDSRPFGFGQGYRMRSLDWLYPSVMAGALRTLVGISGGRDFSADALKNLKNIEVAGPFPCLGNELFFPAPLDLLVWVERNSEERKLMALRPDASLRSETCDLPEGLLPVQVLDDVKPAKIPGFWSGTMMTSWLLDGDGGSFPAPPEKGSGFNGYLDIPEKDERHHATIEPDSGSAKEGRLFTTIGLDLNIKGSAEGIALSVRVKPNGNYEEICQSIDELHPLGGERRLIRWRATDTNAWAPPAALVEALATATNVRLCLATPALFQNGWKPSWLDSNLEGSPPGSRVKVKLKSACVGRWRAISGWDFEKRYPKPIRRLVPAGSVYFFEVRRGDPAELARNHWLESVSDDVWESPDEHSDQNRRDGFGIALWGLWSES